MCLQESHRTALIRSVKALAALKIEIQFVPPSLDIFADFALFRLGVFRARTRKIDLGEIFRRNITGT